MVDRTSPRRKTTHSQDPASALIAEAMDLIRIGWGSAREREIHRRQAAGWLLDAHDFLRVSGVGSRSARPDTNQPPASDQGNGTGEAK